MSNIDPTLQKTQKARKTNKMSKIGLPDHKHKNE